MADVILVSQMLAMCMGVFAIVAMIYGRLKGMYDWKFILLWLLLLINLTAFQIERVLSKTILKDVLPSSSGMPGLISNWSIMIDLQTAMTFAIWISLWIIDGRRNGRSE